MTEGAADPRSILGFQYATVKRWAQTVHGKLEPSDWRSRVHGFRNPPHWILGHVAVNSDVVPAVADADLLVPKEWSRLFDMGTKPDPEAKGYPSPDELVALIERTMDRNLEILGSVDLNTLGEPVRVDLPEALEGFLRTRERWLAFAPLHLSYHLGQINMIHRALHPEAKGL